MHPPLQAGWIERPHQIFSPGDFVLESGVVIRDFRLSYVVHGELNAARSNAVLALSAISSTHRAPSKSRWRRSRVERRGFVSTWL